MVSVMSQMEVGDDYETGVHGAGQEVAGGF
jgi:hypothetical protein